MVGLLMLSSVLGQTILSARFVSHEINNSSLSSTLMNTVNTNLSRYGISTDVISTKESNRLINQAVKQIYSGKPINLNLQPVTSSVGNSVSQAAAEYGISANIPSSITSGVNSSLSTAVNNELNTSQVKRLTNGISIAKMVNHIVMIASLIALVVMVIMAVIQRHLLSSFSWISLWGTVVVYGLIWCFASLIAQIGAQFPDYSSFTAQLAGDFQTAARGSWLILLLSTVILFGLRLGRKLLQGREP